MKKFNSFNILWHYLKDDKLKIFIYIILVICTYMPALLTAYFEGRALELLITKDLTGFTTFLSLWIGIYIIAYSFLQIPRDSIYNYLEIKFMKNVSRDLYKKIDKLPAIVFEDIGVGEFINRLYTDPDRVMELLAKLIKLVCRSLVIIVVVLAFLASVLVDLSLRDNDTIDVVKKGEEVYYDQKEQVQTRVNDMTNGWEDILQ